MVERSLRLQVCRVALFLVCVILALGLTSPAIAGGALRPGHRSGWPPPPPRVGGDGLGLTGLWESLTSIDGKVHRLVWIAIHNVAKGEVELELCDTEGEQKTGHAGLDAFAYWSRVKANYVKLEDRWLRWANTGGHSKDQSKIQLRWVHWLEMRGTYALVKWTRPEKSREYYWIPYKKYGTVWRRLVPNVSLSALKIVKRTPKADECELTVLGRNLPKYTYGRGDYPYFLKFVDGRIEHRGAPMTSTRTKMHLWLRLHKGVGPGPQGAYIMGRYVPRLFVVPPARSEGVLEFVDEQGRETPVVGMGAQVALRLTLNPKDAGTKTTLKATVKSGRGGKTSPLELTSKYEGVFLSHRISSHPSGTAAGLNNIPWRPGDRLLATFNSPTLNKPLRCAVQLARQELYFTDSKGRRLKELPFGGAVRLAARFDFASRPGTKSLDFVVASALPDETARLRLVADKKDPMTFCSAEKLRIVADADEFDDQKGTSLIEGYRGGVIRARYAGPIGGTRHPRWLTELAAEAGVAIRETDTLIDLVDKAGRPFERGAADGAQFVPLDTDLYVRVRLGKKVAPRPKVVNVKMSTHGFGATTVELQVARQTDGQYRSAKPFRLGQPDKEAPRKTVFAAVHGTKLTLSYRPGQVGAKEARSDVAAFDTRAWVIRFRGLGGRSRKSIRADEKFIVEVVMRGIEPGHPGVITVVLARGKNDWNPAVVRLYGPRSRTDYTFTSDMLEDEKPVSLVVGSKLTATYHGRRGDKSYTARSGPLLITAAK